MKPIILFYSMILLSVYKINAQQTTSAFGSTAFYCFQHNRLDSLFSNIPSLQDLSAYARSLGIVEGSPAYTSFTKRYPLVIKSFKDKCYQIQRDSLDYKFSWIHARIVKIEPVEKTNTPDNVPNKNPVVLNGVNVYFSSGGQTFILKFGDLQQYGGVWKSGNNVSLTIHYE